MIKTLSQKLTIIVASALATLCAVFGVATLKPSKAFAATENSVARFESAAYLAPTEDLNFTWRYDPSAYYAENIKVTLNIGLYELATVSTGFESVDQNITFSDLSTTSYNLLESHEVIIYNNFSKNMWTSRKNGIEHTQTLNKVTMEPLINVVRYIDTNSRPTRVKYSPMSLKDYFAGETVYEKFGSAHNINFVIDTLSSNANYVIGISTAIESYEDGSGNPFKNRNCKATSAGKPYQSVSPITSVITLVNNAVTNNEYTMPYLEDGYSGYTGVSLFDKTAYINGLYDTLIASSLIKNVEVKYLVPIAEGVPFAKKVTETIEVRLDKDGNVNAVDVCKAIGVPYFEVFGTIYNGIEETSEDVWTVKYPCDLWLASKTVDGKVTNHFLNINVSFQEYFYPFVVDGVFSQGVYEFLYANAIGNVYPEIASQGLSYADVYGYWDYIVLPETKQAGEILKNVLGTDEKYVGFTKEFHYVDTLTASGYDKLLEEYHYSYLARVWEHTLNTVGLLGPYEATHYLLICDPILKDALLSESGSDGKHEDGGVPGDMVEETGGWLGGIVEDLKGLGSDFTAVISGRGTVGQYIAFGSAGVLVLGVFILIFMARTGQLGSFTSSRGKNNGKRKKK